MNLTTWTLPYVYCCAVLSRILARCVTVAAHFTFLCRGAEVARARAAQLRLQRGIWTSTNFGDVRRALAGESWWTLSFSDFRSRCMFRSYDAIKWFSKQGVNLIYCSLRETSFAWSWQTRVARLWDATLSLRSLWTGLRVPHCFSGIFNSNLYTSQNSVMCNRSPHVQRLGECELLAGPSVLSAWKLWDNTQYLTKILSVRMVNCVLRTARRCNPTTSTSRLHSVIWGSSVIVAIDYEVFCRDALGVCGTVLSTALCLSVVNTNWYKFVVGANAGYRSYTICIQWVGSPRRCCTRALARASTPHSCWASLDREIREPI